MTAVLLEIYQPSINEIRLKITLLKFPSNFPGANESSPQTIWLSRACRWDSSNGGDDGVPAQNSKLIMATCGFFY